MQPDKNVLSIMWKQSAQPVVLQYTSALKSMCCDCALEQDTGVYHSLLCPCFHLKYAGHGAESIHVQYFGMIGIP